MKGDKTVWRDFLPLSAAVAIGVVLAISAFAAVRGYYRTLDAQQFRRNATFYATSFQDDVARHVTSLAAIRAFVSATRSVTRWEFSTYAGQVLPQNPGFRAVLWVPNIPKAGRQAYEAGLQQDGLYGLRIRELADKDQIVTAGERTEYQPISYVEPFEGNDNLVGLDLSPLARYADLFRAARHSGGVAASPPMQNTLVAGGGGPAVLLAFPLNPNGAAATPTGPAPQGYALGVMQFAAIMRDAANASGAPVEAAIAYADTKAGPRILAGGNPPALDGWLKDVSFRQTLPFTIADRHFVLALRSTAHPDAVTAWYVPAGASLLVLALTALLTQNMASTVLRRRLVERAVVARTAELYAANTSLQEEVVQRRQAEAQLRTARDRAESASRAKSAFMAAMSHELRTPLNAIIGFSSLLQQKQEGDTGYAGEILGSGKRLLDLINDILDLTQMEPGQDSGALVYLADCIAVTVEDAQAQAHAAGVLLKASVPDRLPALQGDSKRITKALAHLISNAVKFTPQGGAAVVTARLQANGGIALEVTDTGVGMAADAKEKIREGFFQQDGRLGRRYEGMGLGLTYVGKVAELHDAHLDIVSEPGKGTHIRMIFHPSRTVRDLEVA